MSTVSSKADDRRKCECPQQSVQEQQKSLTVEYFQQLWSGLTMTAASVNSMSCLIFSFILEAAIGCSSSTYTRNHSARLAFKARMIKEQRSPSR